MTVDKHEAPPRPQRAAEYAEHIGSDAASISKHPAEHADHSQSGHVTPQTTAPVGDSAKHTVHDETAHDAPVSTTVMPPNNAGEPEPHSVPESTSKEQPDVSDACHRFREKRERIMMRFALLVAATTSVRINAASDDRAHYLSYITAEHARIIYAAISEIAHEMPPELEAVFRSFDVTDRMRVIHSARNMHNVQIELNDSGKVNTYYGGILSKYSDLLTTYRRSDVSECVFLIS